MLHLFFIYCYGDPRDLHSFPTRRSSDISGHRPGVSSFPAGAVRPADPGADGAGPRTTATAQAGRDAAGSGTAIRHLSSGRPAAPLTSSDSSSEPVSWRAVLE